MTRISGGDYKMVDSLYELFILFLVATIPLITGLLCLLKCIENIHKDKEWFKIGLVSALLFSVTLFLSIILASSLDL